MVFVWRWQLPGGFYFFFFSFLPKTEIPIFYKKVRMLFVDVQKSRDQTYTRIGAKMFEICKTDLEV